MADKTIHELDLLASPADDDEVGIWDLSAGQHMRIQRSVLLNTAAILGAAAQTFTGRVGVGGATPTARLHVNGSIMAAGSESDTIFDGTATADNASLIGPGGYWAMRSNSIHSFNFDVYNNASPITALIIDQAGDFWVAGNCSALSFTDRTEFFKGDALAELATVKAEEASDKLDHASLPTFARHENGGRDLGNMISLLTVAVQQLLARIEVLEAGGGKLP